MISFFIKFFVRIYTGTLSLCYIWVLRQVMITEIQISKQRLLLDRFPCGAGIRYRWDKNVTLKTNLLLNQTLHLQSLKTQ